MKKTFFATFKKRILPNMHWMLCSKIRRCACCQKMTLVASFSRHSEFRFCVRCRANLRHEMVAKLVRAMDYSNMTIVELSAKSPLQSFLSGPRYIRTYYNGEDAPGTMDKNGARHEDITQLSFADESIDLIISGDVIEHVPDGKAAMSESCRVLRRGGSHIFTVPTLPGKGYQRAKIENGEIIHLAEPEYHGDPASDQGILAYWSYGTDLPEMLATEGLKIEIAAGPVSNHRVVWKATKL